MQHDATNSQVRNHFSQTKGPAQDDCFLAFWPPTNHCLVLPSAGDVIFGVSREPNLTVAMLWSTIVTSPEDGTAPPTVQGF